MKGYWINEIFYSVQGEGIRAGTANIFLRFKGCNLACSMEASDKSPGGFNCDTEFESGMKMSGADILARCLHLTGGKPTGIIFTGGEPALQLDKELVDLFKDAGFFTAIETNGTICVDDLGLDFITVSPKVAEHAVKQLTADEVRYVRGYGQAVPKPACKAEHQIVSPAFYGNQKDDEAIAWCIKLVNENPDWRMSVQQHKIWGAR
jgi:7-carboxy-7-deazaguanine synthase